LIKEGDYLIDMGEEVNNQYPNHQEMARVNAWIMRSGQIIKTLCNKNDLYLINFEQVLNNSDFSIMSLNEERNFAVILGIIQGLYADYSSGLLDNVRNLLRGEIFNDFLDMGSHLLEEGYKDAAAVITGSVLEDTLRKIALKNKINIKKDDGKFKTISPLNQDIYKKKVYDSFTQKSVTTWADLRNNAAHGHYEKYDKEQVKLMLLFVQDFCTRNLSN
jgi:hypothetical protein